MKRIAIITARSGSKGLKDKNIRPFCGKPLIAHTIEAAIQANCFDEVHVSTDSEKYAEISRSYGASVPFLRSTETATDAADSWDVVREVLCRYQEQGKTFDVCVLLQPTSPLRCAQDIAGCVELYSQELGNSVISVCEVEHPVQWAFPILEDGTMDIDEIGLKHQQMRRQDLQTHYRVNGAVYVVSCEKIMDREYNLYADNCRCYVMPQERCIDIDGLRDFVIAENLLQNLEE